MINSEKMIPGKNCTSSQAKKDDKKPSIIFLGVLNG